MTIKEEEALQINIVNWFNYEFPELADDFHHFANERFIDVKKNPGLWSHAKKLTKMGVKKGILDTHLAFPCGGYLGLWVELKTEKGKLTPEQIAFIKRKNSRGYKALAVWGFEEAKESYLIYLSEYIANRVSIIPKICL